ncbi:MAG: aminodeoxychorismate synthase, component I [Deltaproteobacteria bacterium]|nr:aminodeoxychorismate synthase, component I [Deltaproteobacteria bacterium]
MIRAALARASGRDLLVYTRPQAVHEAWTPADVPNLLARVESLVEATGLHAVGFVGYEAGSAFDEALPWRFPGQWPLAWFALFPQPVACSCPKPRPLPVIEWNPELDEASYRRALDCIRDLLAAGETYQVNFTYRLRAVFRSDPWSFFCRLFRNQPSPHAVYLEAEDWAICSASPELFFRRTNRVILSQPMKGTARRGRFMEEDDERAASLQSSAKERAENVMIVDMVRNDLGRACVTGSVHVPRLFSVERYPTLLQMTSLVCGRVESDLPSLFRALFPAASITGAPKVRTAAVIHQLEVSPRRIYTGALGVVRPGRRIHFNVAIRTVLVHKTRGEAEYGVGSGIVWDSHNIAEFAETRLKARVLDHDRPEFCLVETMKVTSRGVPLWPWHRRRMEALARYWGFRIPRASIERELSLHCRDFVSPCILRLALTRQGERLWEVRPIPVTPRPYRLAWATRPVDQDDPFCFHKTTLRNELNEQRARARSLGAHDALLYNRKGEVTETTIANILIRVGGEWITPFRACGLLAGVGRQRLLERGRVREAHVGRRDLECGERILLVNAVRGAWPAVMVPEE